MKHKIKVMKRDMVELYDSYSEEHITVKACTDSTAEYVESKGSCVAYFFFYIPEERRGTVPSGLLKDFAVWNPKRRCYVW